MKLLAIFAVGFSLTITAIEARADDTNSILPTIGAAQAAGFIGKQAVVTGVVAQVSSKASFTFLNFDKRYPSNLFTAVIRGKYTNEFENLSGLRRKSVSVKGEIKNYNGKPEMELTNAAQLKILGGSK